MGNRSARPLLTLASRDTRPAGTTPQSRRRLPRARRARQARPPQALHRLRRRRRQDLPHARRGARVQASRRRHRDRVLRDARPGGDYRAQEGGDVNNRAAHRISRRHRRRDGHEGCTPAQARRRHHRRTRPHQRPRRRNRKR